MKTKFLFVMFLGFLLGSCGKETNIVKFPAFESRQVLSAYFTDEMDSMRLYIANSVPAVGEEESSVVANADVGLYYHDEKMLSFEPEGGGFYHVYRDTFRFVEGEEYEIRSRVDGLPDISAKAIFPMTIKLDSIDVKDYNNGGAWTKMFFKDPTEYNYYGYFKVRFYVNDSLIASADEARIGALAVWKTISDVSFDGDFVTVDILADVHGVKIWKPNTKVKGEFVHINRLWYEYDEAIWGNVPDPEDLLLLHSTENLPTNVEGGYGLFGLGNKEHIEKLF